MATFQAVLDRLRPTLNDTDKVRYPDPELLAYALDGLRETCVLRPDLFTVTGAITCVAGVEQTIVPNGWFVIDVYGVQNGGAITYADFDTFRAYRAGWRTDPAGPAVHWMRFPADASKQPNNRFYVYPKSLAGQLLDASWTELNTTALTINSTIPLNEQYEPALESYVIFRAESKDDEFVVTPRAALFRAAFETSLGTGAASEMVKQ
jgi:hypothetical protein